MLVVFRFNHAGSLQLNNIYVMCKFRKYTFFYRNNFFSFQKLYLMHMSRETKTKSEYADAKKKAKVLQHFNVAPVYKTNATLHSLLQSGSMCNVLIYI